MEGNDEVKLTAEKKITRAPGITWYNSLYTGILKDTLVDVASSDIEDLRLAAKEFHDSEKIQSSWIGKMIFPILDHFAFKTFLVIITVFLKSWFYGVMTGTNDDPDDDDDDDDDYRRD